MSGSQKINNGCEILIQEFSKHRLVKFNSQIQQTPKPFAQVPDAKPSEK